MISVNEARERILQRIEVLDPLELAVTEAHGCVLAETVTAPEDLPAFPSSAMDGFALRSGDTSAAAQNPVSLTVTGEAAAGRPFAGRVASGEAVRIMTGAAIPEGADAVVAQEEVAVVGSSLAVGRVVKAGDNVRPAGEDVARGEEVLQPGQRLRGMDIGALAALGRSRVLVRPRPRTVVLSTGDELREPGSDLGPGQIRDSNSFTIAGMAREAGSAPVRAGIIPDDPDVLRETFQSYLPQADVFISSGGVSVGDHDHVRDVLSQLGKVEFWKVSVKPGKPLAFGFIEGRPFFGLPGNPVAVAVTFELFVRPALLKMAGRRTLMRPQIDAAFQDDFRQRPGRETYLRVRAWRDAEGWKARLTGRQGSNIVSSVAKANALAVMPGHLSHLRPGDQVRLMLLEPLEGW
ncbi:MAG TPA: gephyrin-like molybdotransferase Glp [Actinomycetota bacterium]|nr:gephyrin-like molybdotransferase Glp [Actinomycetota bacterium]